MKTLAAAAGALGVSHAANPRTQAERSRGVRRKKLSALFVAAAAVAVPTVHADSAVAAASSYRVEVTLVKVGFFQLDDHSCWTGSGYSECADFYGSVSVHTSAPGGGNDGQGVRNIGRWGGTGDFGNAWSSSGTAAASPAEVANQAWAPTGWSGYQFADRGLCVSATYARCDSAYAKGNNKVLLTVRPGESVDVNLDGRDYDSGSGDDVICQIHRSTGPLTSSQLDGLNRTIDTESPSGPDGGCSFMYTVRKLYDIP